MINVINLDHSKIKIDKKPSKNILIYYIGYVTLKDRRYIKINSVNPLYFIINEINGWIEESNGNKYLTLVFTYESKDIMKKFEELWSIIRDLNRLKAYSSNDYDEKYMKIKFNSDDDLPLNKTLEIRNMIIVTRSFFHKSNKCYPQFLL